jgi:hypothetical protein
VRSSSPTSVPDSAMEPPSRSFRITTAVRS